MNIEEIIEEFGEPERAWDKSQSIKSTENSFFVYELHEMFNSWENKVWFFNDLKDFYDFAYSHKMFDYIGRGEYEEYDFDDDKDQTEVYQHLLALKNTIWTSETCEKFIK